MTIIDEEKWTILFKWMRENPEIRENHVELLMQAEDMLAKTIPAPNEDYYEYYVKMYREPDKIVQKKILSHMSEWGDVKREVSYVKDKKRISIHAGKLANSIRTALKRELGKIDYNK